MLSILMDFDSSDHKAAELWALNHSADHDEIHAAVQAKKSVNLENRVLYPVNLKDWDAFSLRHQDVHNDLNAELNLSGSDLMGADLSDRKSMEEWNFVHYREHLAFRTALGI